MKRISAIYQLLKPILMILVFLVAAMALLLVVETVAEEWALGHLKWILYGIGCTLIFLIQVRRRSMHQSGRLPRMETPEVGDSDDEGLAEVRARIRLRKTKVE